MEIDDLIMRCREGTTVEIEDVRRLSRRTLEQVEIIRRIFGKKANDRAPNGRVITPDRADDFLAGMLTRKRGAPKGTGEPWNKTSDEDRQAALKYWQDHSLTNAQLERLSGVDHTTLWRWFADEYPRPGKAGRPPGKRNKR